MGLLDASYSAVNTKKPRKSDRILPATELNARGLLDAATNVPIAGDALSGVLAAYDAAKGDYGSAAVNALGVLPFVSGTFIGKGAKTWDKAKEADAMSRLAKGEDAAKVWKETGYGKAPWDKAARAEIDDSKAKFLKGNVSDPEQYADLFHEAQVRSDGVPLGNALFHKNAYQAYPQEQATRFKVEGEKPHINGNYDPVSRHISITDPYAAKGGNTPESVTLHELQHAIQQREGWARGGSAESMAEEIAKADAVRGKFKQAATQAMTTTDDIARQNALQEIEYYRSRLNPNVEGLTPSEAYSRLAGEAEARLTQARMNLSPEQRLAQYPYDPEYFKQATGVDINNLIVRGLLE